MTMLKRTAALVILLCGCQMQSHTRGPEEATDAGSVPAPADGGAEIEDGGGPPEPLDSGSIPEDSGMAHWIVLTDEQAECLGLTEPSCASCQLRGGVFYLRPRDVPAPPPDLSGSMGSPAECGVSSEE